MVSKVIFSQKSLEQLDNIISYLADNLENIQAASSVFEDAKNTAERLLFLAEKLQLSSHPKLHKMQYRIIHFKHHRYIMIYRIINETVFIEAIYHTSQDYENALQ